MMVRVWLCRWGWNDAHFIVYDGFGFRNDRQLHAAHASSAEKRLGDGDNETMNKPFLN
jgi:hypothetical protein